MSNNIIKSFAEKTGKTEKAVEKLWDKSKLIAKKAGHEEDYDYIVGILKNMLNINEKQTFREFLNTIDLF